MYSIKDRISLHKLGHPDVGVTSLRIAGGPGMSTKTWAGMVGRDIIRQLFVYHIAVDPERAEGLYHEFGDALVQLMEQPVTQDWKGKVPRMRRDWRALCDLVERASGAFAKLENGSQRRGGYGRVFVSGDLMTKGNDFANASIYKHLAKRGVRPVTEPAGDFLEYLARAQPHLIFGRGASKAKNLLYLGNMLLIRKELYGLARQTHDWLPMPDVKASLQASADILDVSTNATAVLAVGSVLHHWSSGDYDGVVMTACWGCDNGLVGESILRHQQQIPLYCFYDDATPLDERRLGSFVFRLLHQRKEPGHKGSS